MCTRARACTRRCTCTWLLQLQLRMQPRSAIDIDRKTCTLQSITGHKRPRGRGVHHEPSPRGVRLEQDDTDRKISPKESQNLLTKRTHGHAHAIQLPKENAQETAIVAFISSRLRERFESESSLSRAALQVRTSAMVINTPKNVVSELRAASFDNSLLMVCSVCSARETTCAS